ncbi:MAG: 3'-5' exonuclease [Kofleriaceae bacterium]|nr:3'-5' exonuclease [Myxococcales bacterium]MCB9565170.1 3'-5' exonuclease [Kofleriaceae bacterium]MCB9572181.1 3'-5' exonuclease [Kofleriaceae bacterium]
MHTQSSQLPLLVTSEVAAEVTAETGSEAVPQTGLVDDGVVVFDVETTGTDRRRDQVIELCVQNGLGPDARSRVWRCCPSVPISAGAQAVHGISMEDLEDAPPFAALADEITQVFAEAKVLVGYNLAFDIEMIQAEFERLGRPPIDLTGKTIVDAFRLWQQFEPRSLQNAHQRFVGESFAAAHTASADVAATGRVLSGMVRAFGLDGRDWNALAGACDPDGRLRPPNRSSWVGPSRHLQWNEAGDVVMTFGKHANLALHVVARNDAGYVRWVTGKDFPDHVIEICEKALELAGDGPALVAWVRKRYGQAAPTAAPAFAPRQD